MSCCCEIKLVQQIVNVHTRCVQHERNATQNVVAASTGFCKTRRLWQQQAHSRAHWQAIYIPIVMRQANVALVSRCELST